MPDFCTSPEAHGGGLVPRLLCGAIPRDRGLLAPLLAQRPERSVRSSLSYQTPSLLRLLICQKFGQISSLPPAVQPGGADTTQDSTWQRKQEAEARGQEGAGSRQKGVRPLQKAPGSYMQPSLP